MTADLIARLEAAEVGSRELDAAIWAAMQPVRVKVADVWPVYGDEERTSIRFTLPPKRTETTTNSVGPYRHAEPVTTSLDAALALAERVLEGWPCWGVATDIPGRIGAVLAKSSRDEGVTGYASTPALALVIALLRAKQGEGE